MRFVVPLIVAVGICFASGCVGCESELTHTSDRCPDHECVECSDHDDCDEGAFCGEDQGEQVCLIQECEPDATGCEGDTLVRCDDVGSGYLDPVDCPGGCDGGECMCDDIDDCATGESCTDDRCICPTDVRCGEEGACCGEAEICAPAEVCDGDGNCETADLCQPECSGEYCGEDNEICCEGDEPVCNPFGECVPDCGADSQLCGDDFDTCCDAGDVCIFGDCVTPGQPCDSFADCSFDEYCDEGLGKCMPDEFPDDIECSMEGDFEEMEVTEKWSWTDEDIISSPVVGDVTADGEPNVVVNAARIDGGGWPIGKIFILDSTGDVVRSIPHDPDQNSWGSHGRSNIAIADVSGDGVLDIIYATRPVSGADSYIVAVDGQGELLWRAHDANGDPVTEVVNNGGVTAANFDGDPQQTEIVVGAMLIDSDGQVVWHEPSGGTPYGTNAGYNGGLPVVADLTGDGNHEIITGRDAWQVDWQSSPGSEDPQVEVTRMWQHDGPDGYPAVADINGDSTPEVVLVASQTVRVLDGDSGELFCGVDPTGDDCDDDDSLRTQPVTLPGPSTNNRGGPPTVADFDGDGRPEIGVAGGHYYTVFDVYRPGFGDDDDPENIDEDLLDQFDQDDPELGEIYVRWTREIQDLSSNATGSSVFDFQGDGSASVIYGDECFMRSYSGVDGQVELEIMNSTATILEYPIVVDVDENGRSEILVVANDVDHCSDWVDGYQTRAGIFVYEDPNELWVHTRSIWNQHAYSIDNIYDDGSMPDLVDDWWNTHNTFRANRQGEVPLHAPDVTVSTLQADDVLCPQQPIEFRATIENQGKRVVTEGLPVSLYNADTGELLETKVLTESISPGGMVEVRFHYEVDAADINSEVTYMVVANDEDAEDGEPVDDCEPDNASAQITALCYVPG